jgi:hypothetical protein
MLTYKLMSSASPPRPAARKQRIAPAPVLAVWNRRLHSGAQAAAGTPGRQTDSQEAQPVTSLVLKLAQAAARKMAT